MTWVESSTRVVRPGLASHVVVVLAWLAVALLVGVPVASVFTVALSEGLPTFWAAITEPDTLAAAKLTLLTTAVAVPLNTVFGVAAAWALTRHRFPGRAVVLALIEVPFAVSPVVAGLLFVLLFGARGAFGPWLLAHDLRVIYAVPGIALATTFITLPFVARELIPLMESMGDEEETAATTLGARGFQTFFRVTFPAIRWALLSSVVVCTARAVGEFGAVSVVSGHIRGVTNTLPLHVETLHNEYNEVGAFAVASLLASVAVLGLAVKRLAQWQARRARAPEADDGGAPTEAPPEETPS